MTATFLVNDLLSDIHPHPVRGISIVDEFLFILGGLSFLVDI